MSSLALIIALVFVVGLVLVAFVRRRRVVTRTGGGGADPLSPRDPGARGPNQQ